jgi:hypothetical protein
MDQIDVVKLLGQSGIAVTALYVLARIVWRVGERMIAAIDRVGVKIEEHTKADTAALAAVSVHVSSLRQDIAVLSGRVDTVIEWGGSERTPVLESGGHRRPPLGDPDDPDDFHRRPRRG